MRNLDFDDKALERLMKFDKLVIEGFEDKFGLMNIGQLLHECSISGTDPMVYETRAAYDHRIYWRHNGAQRACILLVGDKDSQSDDCSLRKGWK